MRDSPRSTRPPLLLPTFLSSLVSISFVRSSRPHRPSLSIIIRFSPTAETWSEYGTQWKEYYDAKIAGKPIQTKGPTLPPLPTSEATGAEWATWGKAVADAWTEYAASKGVDLAKVVEGLKYPELPTENTREAWGTYATQWGDYGKQVGERFEAVLAAKSA